MKKTKAEINEENYRAKGALDILMCYLGMEHDSQGNMFIYNDDEDVSLELYINGLKCIYPFVNQEIPIQKNEIEFNVYFNTRLMISILDCYFAEKGYIVNIQKITNARPNTIGHVEIEFANGVVYKSDAYFKDSLKYIDIIMKLEQAPLIEFERLRSYDSEK